MLISIQAITQLTRTLLEENHLNYRLLLWEEALGKWNPKREPLHSLISALRNLALRCHQSWIHMVWTRLRSSLISKSFLLLISKLEITRWLTIRLWMTAGFNDFIILLIISKILGVLGFSLMDPIKYFHQNLLNLHF